MWTWFQFFSYLLLWQLGCVWGASCPWEEKGLDKWSESSTWSSGKVPGENSKVTIPKGKRVLLDVQPAFLGTLTIEEGAALIWGDVDDLVLNTHYIWVKGEFHMGSRTCRFNHNARIRLHGHSKDSYEVKDHEFGRKFIGVAPNGTLEIHGKLKTSWTKLAQTVKPLKDVTCALVYDHSNEEHNKVKLNNWVGLNVLVWNQDGSFMDFCAFKEYTEFADFFKSIPDGKVVAMFANGKSGIMKTTANLQNTIADLGGTLIKKIENNNGYSFLGRKGSKDTVKEVIREDNSEDGEERAFLSLHDENKKLVFQVAVNPGTVKDFQMFRVLNEDAAFPKLPLVDEVKGWKEGDQVLLTSTDFEWTQAEVRKIEQCKDCNSRQIRLNEPLLYLHYGNFTQRVDERGEVAMLSRHIVIEGVMEDTCTERTQEEKDRKLCNRFGRDTFGGHLMVARYFKSVHVRGVRLYHMGQQKHRGAYPLHFHMCDNANGAYLRENTVVDSFSRCFTVHGTDELEVSDNVCFEHIGHGLFLEDSVEQNNKVFGNLIAGSKHGTLLHSDCLKEWCKKDEEQHCDGLSSYWLTHPNNEIKNNVAAGGEGSGFMYMFADLPLGPSRQRQKELNRTHSPKTFPLRFSGNVAHSYKSAGIHMDEKISTGTGIENKGNVVENAILRTDNEYDPHVNGVPVWTEMSYGTYYKNKVRNVWVKGGNINLTFSTFADSREGFTGGTTLFNSGTAAYKCIFIGETDNKGLSRKWNVDGYTLSMNRSYSGIPSVSMTGTSLYQGPNIIKSCFFDKYPTISWCLQEDTPLSECDKNKVITRHSGAISFKRANTYPTMTSSYTENNTFGFCDDEDGQHWVYQGPNSLPDWEWKDGNRGVFLRDKDGKLTGTVNASIVPDFPFYSGDECLLKKDWGDLLICPYRYIKMEILGTGGNLASSKKDKYPLIIQRDDKPYNKPFLHMGEIRNEFLMRVDRSYIVDFNKSLSNAAFPSEMKIMGYGVEKGDVVRVGICQPKDVTGYEIIMHYPAHIKNNATWVNSLADLDKDTTGAAFYHDKSNGLLFFKILSFHQDTNETQLCPDGHCWKVTIKLIGGSKQPVRTCAGKVEEPFNGKLKPPRKPTPLSCPGIATPEGLGAVDFNKVGYIEHNEYSVSCRALDSHSKSSASVKGCYKEKVGQTELDLKSNEASFLFQTMTPDFCVTRCYHREYKFAGLSRSSRCTCSNASIDPETFHAPESDCNMDCRGDSKQKCGGNSTLTVWNTGF